MPDQALRPILCAFRSDDPAIWNPILLLLFFPTLERIYRRKRRWGERDDEFWSDVLAAFCLAVTRIDPDRRPERIAQKIYGDTVRGTYVTRHREWRRARREVLAQDDKTALLLDLADPEGATAEEATDWRCDRESRRRFYMGLLGRQVIGADDYLLLCGTRICGWTISTCAARLEMSAAAAKKRIQRAEARIRGVDPLSCGVMSPTCVPDVPKRVAGRTRGTEVDR